MRREIDPVPAVHRRKVLQLAGIAGASTLAAGGGIVLSTGEASATAGGDIDNPSVAQTDDGRIKWVVVQSTGRVNWDGFDKPATYGRILNGVELVRNGNTLFSGNINDTKKIDLTQSDWGSAGDKIVAGQSGRIVSDVDWGICQRGRNNLYNNGYGLPQNPAPVDYFTADTDGGEQKTKVILTAQCRLYDSNRSELTGTAGYPSRPTFASEFVVTVANEEATIESGPEDAEGDSDDKVLIGTDTPAPAPSSSG